MSAKFGELFRYPDDQGVGDQIVFMHLGTVEHKGMEYRKVMVLRTVPEDDQWGPGSIVLAGRDELVPYEEPRFLTGLRDISGSFSGLLDLHSLAGPASVFIDGTKIGEAIVQADGTFTITNDV